MLRVGAVTIHTIQAGCAGHCGCLLLDCHHALV
jgi:hypothetical protein